MKGKVVLAACALLMAGLAVRWFMARVKATPSSYTVRVYEGPNLSDYFWAELHDADNPMTLLRDGKAIARIPAERVDTFYRGGNMIVLGWHPYDWTYRLEAGGWTAPDWKPGVAGTCAPLTCAVMIWSADANHLALDLEARTGRKAAPFPK
jgi:hypothetical protein